MNVNTFFKTILLSLCVFVYMISTSHAASSLADQIQIYLEQQSKNKKTGKFSAEDKAIMKKAATDLAKAIPNPGLKVGDKAPDFSLPNAYGKQVTLSSLLKKGPVVMNFYRGAWCPFCNLELSALKQNLPEFKKYGARLISITPQKPDKSLAQVKKAKLQFDILSDLDSAVIKKYKLFFTLPPKLTKLYKKLGLDIEAFNGKGRNELPIPGTYVIDTKGVVRAAYANTDYTKRMEPQAIIDALKKL